MCDALVERLAPVHTLLQVLHIVRVAQPERFCCLRARIEVDGGPTIEAVDRTKLDGFVDALLSHASQRATRPC